MCQASFAERTAADHMYERWRLRVDIVQADRTRLVESVLVANMVYIRMKVVAYFEGSASALRVVEHV